VPKITIKGLHVVKAKGRTYCYAWRGGPRIEAEYGTAAFFAELDEHKNPAAKLDSRKLDVWIVRYKASDEFKNLAETTRRVWGRWFDIIRDEFGNLSTRQFDRPEIRVDIRRWRNKWKDRPRTADIGKQVLSRILSFAVAEGGLGSNPCEGVPNLYSNDRSDLIWEPADLDALCKVASAEIGHAARLAALTGLRQGDLLKLSWSHIGEHAIEIRTGKSRGKRAAIAPLTAEIRALLETIPRRSTQVLTNSEGHPWKGFGSSWNKAMRTSGLTERGLHFHDLRGTAATNLFRAGFTIREIAETMAWSEDKVERLIDRYVKRDEILKDRIRRLEAVKVCVNPF
jgi:integrase